MKIKLAADSSANLFAMENADFSVVPMKIVVGQQEFEDREHVDLAAMQKALREYKGKSSSACPSVGDWMEAFGEEEAVIALSITSKLSGAHNAACIAAEQYEAEHPGRRVFVLDTLSTGPEMTLLLYRLAERSREEQDFDTLCQEITEYSRKHTQLLFCLSSMANLAKNGRVSPALAKAVGLLGIRIVGEAREGDLNPLHKCRGEKKAIQQIFATMKEKGYRGGRLCISHSENEAAAEELARQVRAEYPEASIQIMTNGALCSYYAEEQGLLIGYEI